VVENKEYQLKYQRYLEERRLLIEGESKVSARFDTSLLTLSGGALILSMTFIKDLVKNAPLHKCALVVAWISYGLTITLMLISLLTSQRAFIRQRDILDATLDDPAKNSSCNCWSCATKWLNRISIGAFVVATIFMGYFIIINL